MPTLPHTHVRSFGDGPRRAMAIHCTLAHSGMWAGLAKTLADRLTITAYDLPSHGKSAEWTPDRDQHRMATDMGLALLSEPMDLIGHSFGATVALRMAVERPELVRSLTLIEPVYFAVALLDQPASVDAHNASLSKYTTAIAAGDNDLAARLFNREWGNGTQWVDIPETARRYMADRIHFVPGGQPFLMHDNANLLASGGLGKLTMPVLLIQGEHTPDVIDAVHAALARRIAKPIRVTIAGAGHMSPITHPQAVAQQILKLIEVS